MIMCNDQTPVCWTSPLRDIAILQQPTPSELAGLQAHRDGISHRLEGESPMGWYPFVTSSVRYSSNLARNVEFAIVARPKSTRIVVAMWVVHVQVPTPVSSFSLQV